MYLIAVYVNFCLFYPRDAIRKLGLCCRPSDTLVHCIHTAEDIVRLLIRPGSPIILLSCAPAPVPNSKGNPFSGGKKYTGVRKIGD